MRQVPDYCGRLGAVLNVLCLALMVMVGAAYATEGSGERLPCRSRDGHAGQMPAPGGTMFAEFDDFYQANELVGSNGHALLPGFHLRVGAVAVKVVHNWGVHVLGGTLVSSGALPLLYVHLDAPFGKGDKTGIGNPDVETLVAYSKGSLHWWYGFDVLHARLRIPQERPGEYWTA